MKKGLVFIFMLFLPEILVAQNVRVSQKIADAMGSGQYYMKLKTQSTDFGGGDNDEESSDTYKKMMEQSQMEIACKGNSALTRMSLGNYYSSATLYANGHNYRLDEDQRTYQVQRGSASNPGALKLTYRKQGQCKVNGNPYYYDEYAVSGGTVTFYYNSDRVAIIDFGPQRGGAMALLSFSKYIPDHMFFCLDNRWKGTGSPAPPRCATPWKDNTKYEELACGESLSTPVEITDKRPVDKPVWLAQFGTSSPVAKPSSSRYSVDGILEAVKEITAKMPDDTDGQVLLNMIDACNKDMAIVAADCVTGEVMDNAIARAFICPHPIVINSAASTLICGGCIEEAVNLLEEAQEIDPENPFVASNLAECYLEQNKPEKAHKVMAKIIEVYPERGELHQKLAETLLAKGEMIAAVDEFFIALSMGFCDESMASYLTQLVAALHEGVDDKENQKLALKLLKRIYSEENMMLLEKAVKYDSEQYFNNAGNYDFKWHYAPEQIESMYKSLDKKGDKIRDMAARYEELFKTSLFDTQAWWMSDPTLSMLAERKEGLDSLDVQEQDMTYAPGFWALYMIEAYHLLNLEYADGTHTKNTKENETKIRAGWCPREFTRLDEFIDQELNEMNRQLEENSKKKELEEKDIASMLAFAKIEFEYESREYELEKRTYQAIVRHEKQYYHNHILPAIENYWKAINELTPYLQNNNARNYFVYRVKHEFLTRYMDTYRTGAYYGSLLDNKRQTYDYTLTVYQSLLKEANRAKDAEQLEHLREKAEEEAYLQEMEDLKEDPLQEFRDIGKMWPDFSLTVGDKDLTPFSISFGKKGDHAFIEITNHKTGKTQGHLSGIGHYTRILDTYRGRGFDQNTKDWQKNAQKTTKQLVSQKLLGKLPIIGEMMGNVTGAAQSVYSSPVEFNNTSETTYQYDSNGHLLREAHTKTTTATSGMLGGLSASTIDTSSRHLRGWDGGVTGSVSHHHEQVNFSVKIFKFSASQER